MRFLKFFLLFICLTLSANAENTKVDKIIVHKADRKMELFSGSTLVKKYNIALGGQPVGPKQVQGDSKTPEGDYIISGRNDKSAYHLSLRVSYPNAEDRARAKKLGKNPGGDIMIHGLPNGFKWTGQASKMADWTDGCIAVTNAEIEEIWKLVNNGTKITILP